MRYARVDNGQVVEIIELPGQTDPAQHFHRAFAQTLVADPEGTATENGGWDGTGFSPPATVGQETEAHGYPSPSQQLRALWAFVETLETDVQPLPPLTHATLERIRSLRQTAPNQKTEGA